MTAAAPPAAAWRARLTARLASWEGVLAVVLVLDFVLQAIASPYFLDLASLSDASFNFTEKGLVALPLALLIVAGEIDISVAGIMALASVAMGLAAERGVGLAGLWAVGVGTGLLCGAVNAFLVAGLRVPSIVATIGAMSLYRGAAYAVLGDRALKAYPPGFAWFGQGHVIPFVSFELVAFALAALACGAVLHRTAVGRRIYALGANPVAARWSGVAVTRYRCGLFLAVGAASGLAAILLTSRLGSTRPSIAQGWELDIISLVILGGVQVSGGRGSIPGVVLACLLFGFATFGLGLLNVPGIVVSMLMGALLIAVVAGPRLIQAAARAAGAWAAGRTSRAS